MKNLLAFLFSAERSKLNLALGGLLLAAFVLACGGSSAPKTPIPEAYLGTWTGQDGTILTIRADNTGDYKAGSSKVDGAAIEVDEAGKEIRFKMVGVDVGKYAIDSPPSGNQMRLGGQTFQRSDGGGNFGGATNSSTGGQTNSATTRAADSATVTDVSPASGADPDIPDDAELQTLVKTTLLDFNSAVQSGSFDSFHSSASSYFQDQFTVAQLEQKYGEFIRRKIDISDIAAKQASMTPAFENENGIKVLNANGSYPTAPATSFELQYIQEDVEWKLLSINVRIK